MPFALLIIGLFLLIAGVRNTQDQLFGLVSGDFKGQENFLFWLIAILVIGALGYIPKVKPLSTAFLVLILLVLFLKKGNPSGVGGGFFSQFLSAVNATATNSNLPSPTDINAAKIANANNINDIKNKILQNLNTDPAYTGNGLGL
jgi:hypothetical protein